MKKKWIYKSVPDQEKVDALSQSINVNSIIGNILLQRGVEDFDNAKSFFRPNIADLHDPFLMKDMDKAVDRINEAIFNEEKILVYGDYDVDGTTSVTMFFHFLKSIYQNVGYYIPDRYKEGYGVSKLGVEWAEENSFKLIISLDCGVKANEMIRLAKTKGIDFIVCDHHKTPDVLPEAIAVLDPKRPDCNYPFKELSGCGVGFKLMQAFVINNGVDESVLDQYLDLLAVSIASDIVPIVGENRILCHFGLKTLNQSPRPGIKALIDLSGNKSELTISNIVFGIGPRINAAGRIAHATDAVKLLLSESIEEANQIGEGVNYRNETRREIDASITDEAIQMIESSNNMVASTTVLYKEDWHKGVIGIVASRCIEKYYKPTVILTMSEGKATGSARSVRGFDVHEAISSCEDLLDQYGGHMYAAGLSMPINNVPAFQQRFEEVVSTSITEDLLIPKIEIDLPIQLDQITPSLVNILKQMEPFGPENMEPIFSIDNAFIKNRLTVLKEKHIKAVVGQKNNKAEFDMIGFNFAEYYESLAQGELFSLAFIIQENNFRGKKTLQLNVKDIKFVNKTNPEGAIKEIQ
ncbi:MAG: single-stranded-DNA-specific exonuclease RecJ [Cyclobacteriaceae bacterium]|nr:single-stranded-DNA-specific exonuclease RecJ [Cyclobacteriaceae bacterium]